MTPRAPDGDDTARLRAVIQYELRTAGSLRSLGKNGESWLEWLGRIITPERLLWLSMAIFVLGQRTERYQGDVAAALRSSSSLADQQKALSDSQTEMQIDLMSLRESVDDAAQSMRTREASDAAISDRLTATITRAEFQRFQTQILIRLEQIDMRIKGSQP